MKITKSYLREIIIEATRGSLGIEKGVIDRRPAPIDRTPRNRFLDGDMPSIHGAEYDRGVQQKRKYREFLDGLDDIESYLKQNRPEIYKQVKDKKDEILKLDDQLRSSFLYPGEDDGEDALPQPTERTRQLSKIKDEAERELEEFLLSKAPGIKDKITNVFNSIKKKFGLKENNMKITKGYLKQVIMEELQNIKNK